MMYSAKAPTLRYRPLILHWDWLSVSSGAFAGIWAVGFRFYFRYQILNPDEKRATYLAMPFFVKQELSFHFFVSTPW